MEHILETMAKPQKTRPLFLLEVLLSPPSELSRKDWYYRHFGSYPNPQSIPLSEKEKFYRLANYLKREGLIERQKKSKGVLWRTTQRGLEKLALLKKRNLYATQSASYENEKEERDGIVRIISYDIPAREKRKGPWLRHALHNLGFAAAHKSVWVGKRKIPERFLHDLRARRMLGYLHILEVTKTGTLKIKEL